jgi:hypothetical protein
VATTTTPFLLVLTLCCLWKRGSMFSLVKPQISYWSNKPVVRKLCSAHGCQCRCLFLEARRVRGIKRRVSAGKFGLGRPIRRWGIILKWVLQKYGRKGVRWTYLAQDGVRLRGHVDTVTILRNS